MSVISRSPEADPLYAGPRPERAAYATGMMLDAQDFIDEQTYHRGRLARALSLLAGGGTLAGLKVTYQAAAAGPPKLEEEIRVEAGVAVDRLGRQIEITRAACLRLQRWFAGEMANDGGDTLRLASQTNFAGLVGARIDPAGAMPARAVVADVFVRFVACEKGLTPSFAAGPFDALDAVSASRVSDAYELVLVARATGLDTPLHGLPDPGPDLAGMADAVARRSALQDAILAAYPVRGNAGTADAIAPPPGYPAGLDPTAVLLARVLIPIGAADPPQRTADPVRIDNFSRRFIPAATLLARWVGA